MDSSDLLNIEMHSDKLKQFNQGEEMLVSLDKELDVELLEIFQ